MSMTVMTPLTTNIDYGDGYGADEPVLFRFDNHIGSISPFFAHLDDDIMRMQRAHEAKIQGFLNGIDFNEIEFIAHTVTWGEDTDKVGDMLDYVEADRSFAPTSIETAIHLYGEEEPIHISTLK